MDQFQDIISSLEKQFNGDQAHDIEIVREYCRNLPQSEESLRIVTALGRYAAEKFPDEPMVKDAHKIEEALTGFMDKIHHAQDCLREKKYEEALAGFEEVIADVKPPKVEGKRQYSFSHPFEEMILRASSRDNSPIERISPLPEVLYYQKGVCCFEMKRYAEAREAYQNALELNPVNVRTWFEIAQIDKIEGKYEDLRALLLKVHPMLFTRGMLARFYREEAGLAMIEEKYDLAVPLIYISLDYEDTPQARAQLNALAKHRGVNLSKPTADAARKSLEAAKIPVGPAPQVYQLAIDIGNTMKKAHPEIAKMAYAIAYDVTHYEPLLKELNA
ncbi:MAG: tetratricopeptide repeat protein [Proteobacteria bacterium]|nr:tetratricopeptide repeat protein [Pseudomonadota bacterium]